MNSSTPRHLMRVFENERMQLRLLHLAQTLITSLLIVAYCLLFPRANVCQSQATTINFDQLPSGALVTNQYLPKVTFSAIGFSGGPGGPYGNNIFAVNDSVMGGSPPNRITSQTYCASCYPAPYQRLGDVFISFSLPVNNLSFYVLNVAMVYPNSPLCDIDVYVNNRSYYGTVFINATGQTVLVNLASIPNITDIRIRNVNNPGYPLGVQYSVYYDNFTFTPYFDVKITNSRVSGYLNGTTQNALVGADVSLQATMLPSTESGGTYSWIFTGPYSVSGGSQSSSSVTIRSTDVGTITANVNYTRNGFTASGSVTINSVLPTLTSFTAQQGSDLVSPPGTCLSDTFWWYKLGCVATSQVGIHFTSSVNAPPFISDPTQSGIKYVQAVSVLRKKTRIGLRCFTKRSSESDIGSGWQLDTGDPYGADFPEFPVRRFSEGNDLTMLTVDYPRNELTFVTASEFIDSLYVDDRFEMYVVYFTGNPANPPLQKPLGKLAWNWGGLVVFDWNGSNGIHNLRFTNSPPGSRAGAPANSMVTMQGNVTNNVDVPCPGGPPLTNNKIDSSRVFVKYHYLDFLGRNPAGDATNPPDLPGWNYWTSQISQCVFDLNCIHARRINTGLAFFYSGEFIQTDPDLANPPGSPGFNAPVYNRRFVYWCFRKYLQRDPTGDPGWDFWTNVLNSNGDYGQIIDAFQLSGEYRDVRQFS